MILLTELTLSKRHATPVCSRFPNAYAEIYRVLEPGKFYTYFERVTTPKYWSENAEHVEIVHEIGHGCSPRATALVLTETSLALRLAQPWQTRLKVGWPISEIVCLYFLWIASEGLIEMLVKTPLYFTH